MITDVEHLAWIVAGGLGMSLLSQVGAFSYLLSDRTLARLVGPLVAFSAGSLLGGALLHMVPEAAEREGIATFVWLLVGFSVFLALEQFLHWHHCHRESAACGRPLAYLILIGDGVHNFLGGMAVAAAFLMDVRVGITTWLAAAAHEVPQELGDFGVLIHSGWSKGRALLFNLLSALTFLVGGLIAWAAGQRFDTTWLLGLAAGSFVYIGASDLVPEVNRHREPATAALHFGAFVAGVLVLAALRFLGH